MINLAGPYSRRCPEWVRRPTAWIYYIQLMSLTEYSKLAVQIISRNDLWQRCVMCMNCPTLRWDILLDSSLVIKVFSIRFSRHGRDIYHVQAHPAFRSHSTRCNMFSIYRPHRTVPSRCHGQWTTSKSVTVIWTPYATLCWLGSLVEAWD